MRFQQEFTVAAAPDRVWALFGDAPAIARCLPGATLDGQQADGSYSGTIQVKLGPMSASFEGSATVERSDADRRGRISGTGLDRSGGSRGRVDMAFSVTDDEGGATVSIDAEITLSGTAAQFGRPGLIEEMARRMIREFSGCLERRLAVHPDQVATVEAGEIKGIRLLLASLWGAFTGFVRRLLGRDGAR